MANRMKATILDVAQRAGVSKSTVSLVLQGSPLVRPETASRVRAAIEEVGYVYNRGAANLRKAHSNVVGMIINDLTNPFFAELAVDIERVFQSAGLVSFLANTAENPVRQEEVVKSFMEQGVSGLIVSPAHGTRPDAFERIRGSGLPVLFVMRRLPGSRVPVVAPDNHQGAFVGTRHLIGKGHRRIAFLGGFPDMVVYHQRVGGYKAALAAAGIEVDDALIVEADTNRKGGMGALETALARDPQISAALCFNDAVAFGAMIRLRKRGLEPGQDFAIVGFDDVAEAQHYVPALTSVAVDTAGLGERAAHMMLNMIRGGTTHAEDHIGAVNLMVRASCGPELSKGRAA
ncbi:LacI family DNA-binding transcriptional regulator [Chelativorans intermedius]|uniref:LacI family DNA-binding transcriptional regulator n=1 Tax=Chelativorans intermedius TaxID=515947 RepID=A0ABV6D5X4_9HYPH|nr:LacI family DNA-binding transcriptional regulator [Chelativorans intermedius]MCT8997520.1 LacI family DNA-binding transcriptional regulator [Chelativorans intermedius]